MHPNFGWLMFGEKRNVCYESKYNISIFIEVPFQIEWSIWKPSDSAWKAGKNTVNFEAVCYLSQLPDILLCGQWKGRKIWKGSQNHQIWNIYYVPHYILCFFNNMLASCLGYRLRCYRTAHVDWIGINHAAFWFLCYSVFLENDTSKHFVKYFQEILPLFMIFFLFYFLSSSHHMIIFVEQYFIYLSDSKG